MESVGTLKKWDAFILAQPAGKPLGSDQKTFAILPLSVTPSAINLNQEVGLKKSLMLSIGAVVLSVGISAFGYSTTKEEYSIMAVQDILRSRAIEEYLPSDFFVTKIDFVKVDDAAKLIYYAVTAANVTKDICTVNISLSTQTPPNFIGSGLPTFNKVESKEGKCLEPAKSEK